MIKGKWYKMYYTGTTWYIEFNHIRSDGSVVANRYFSIDGSGASAIKVSRGATHFGEPKAHDWTTDFDISEVTKYVPDVKINIDNYEIY